MTQQWYWLEWRGSRAVGYLENGIWWFVTLPDWMSPKRDARGLITGFMPANDKRLIVRDVVDVKFQISRSLSGGIEAEGAETHFLEINDQIVFLEVFPYFVHVPIPVSLDKLDENYLVEIICPTLLMRKNSDLNVAGRRMLYSTRWQVSILSAGDRSQDSVYMSKPEYVSGLASDTLTDAIAWSLAMAGYKAKSFDFTTPDVPPDIDLVIRRRPPVGDFSYSEEHYGEIDATLPQPQNLWHMLAGRFLPDGTLLARDEFEADSLSGIMGLLRYFIVEAYKK